MASSIFHKETVYEKKFTIPGVKSYRDNIPTEFVIHEIKQHIKNLTDKKIFIKLGYFNGMPPKLLNPTVHCSMMFPETLYFYHSHEFYELNVVLSGKCIEYIDNVPLFLESGDMVIMRPDTVYHSAYTIKGTTALNILVPQENMKRIISEFDMRTTNIYSDFIKSHSYCILKGFDSKKLSSLLAPLKKIYFNTVHPPVSNAKDMMAENYFKIFLLYLQQEIDEGRAHYEYSDSKKVSVHSADTIIRYIKEHYTDITMDRLVKKFGYSERQLYRMILTHTGNNFQTQVMYHKLQRARQLLETTNLSVKEICDIIGYESPEYFCRLFKRETFMTPLQYRAKSKEPVDEGVLTTQ